MTVGLKTKIVEYKKSSFAELDMAWATTVHKAQGGESPVVVLVLSNGHGPLLARRLLYTGKIATSTCRTKVKSCSGSTLLTEPLAIPL